MTFDTIGLHVPHILLPNPSIDLTRWSVIACDQYTSQPEYWEEVSSFVGDSPSTLNLILPEVYLDSPDEQERIDRINRCMLEYIQKAILVPQKPGFILTDRKTVNAGSRKGLIVALDLERYEYTEGSHTLIRATEGTIINRLHPRIRIRKNAPLEIPHILVLIDDPEKTVIEPLFTGNLKKVYDFDLMKNGGHLTGRHIDDETIIQRIAHNLERLADPDFFSERYSVADEGVLLYAMGDGNHSFATAKALWETIKADAQDTTAIMNHPARYALVELVNLHDDGLVFTPIHRVVFNCNVNHMIGRMQSFFTDAGSEFSFIKPSQSEVAPENGAYSERSHTIPFITKEGYGSIVIQHPSYLLAVESLQAFLDEYLADTEGVVIDYIHGRETVHSLASQPDTVGFFLPPIAKNDLFKTVILNGALPRKAFSLGEAEEKRFYLESRKII